MRTGLALERLWWVCTFAESCLSLHQCTKTTTYMPIDCMISLEACIHFTFDDIWAHKPSVTLQFMALSSNCDLIHGLIDESDFDSDRCFFLLWLPNLREFCKSKYRCGYAIIVPWITSKNDYYSLFFLCREGSGESVHLHRLTWVFVTVLRYHVLPQMAICVPFTITVNAVVKLHQQPWHI